jgi:hypothetical protein
VEGVDPAVIFKMTTELCRHQLMRVVAEAKDWILGLAEVEFGNEAETPGPEAGAKWLEATDSKNWKRTHKLKLKGPFTLGKKTDDWYFVTQMKTIPPGATVRSFRCIAWGGALVADIYTDLSDTSVIAVILFSE